MEKRHLPLLAITELSSLIEKKEVSPVEVVEAHLERIDRLNTRLHAYLTICREAALRAAREAEQAIVRGQYHGPLHGMPFAVKDQLSTRGLRTTAGSPIFAERVIDEDATVTPEGPGYRPWRWQWRQARQPSRKHWSAR